jgi:hypothetical protein
MENHMKNCDFPISYVKVYQRVYRKLMKTDWAWASKIFQIMSIPWFNQDLWIYVFFITRQKTISLNGYFIWSTIICRTNKHSLL